MNQNLTCAEIARFTLVKQLGWICSSDIKDQRGYATRHGSGQKILWKPLADAPTTSGSSSGGLHENSASVEPSVPTVVPAVRGSDRQPHTRRTYADAGSGPTTLPDWSRPNFRISLQNLRPWNAANVRTELRKLHLRWWHARAEDAINPTSSGHRRSQAWTDQAHFRHLLKTPRMAEDSKRHHTDSISSDGT